MTPLAERPERNTTMYIASILIMLGLPSAMVSDTGVWALRRESGGAARGVGYLLIALGAVLAIATVMTLLFGVGSVTTEGWTEIVEVPSR